jgi:hypothetical protein
MIEPSDIFDPSPYNNSTVIRALQFASRVGEHERVSQGRVSPGSARPCAAEFPLLLLMLSSRLDCCRS